MGGTHYNAVFCFEFLLPFKGDLKRGNGKEFVFQIHE